MITVWLLINIGVYHFGAGAAPTNTVASLSDKAECLRVAKSVTDNARGFTPNLVCIEVRKPN